MPSAWRGSKVTSRTSPRLSTRELPDTNETLTSRAGAQEREHGRQPDAVGGGHRLAAQDLLEPLEAHPRQAGQRLLGLDQAAQHLLDVRVHLQKADAEPARRAG